MKKALIFIIVLFFTLHEPAVSEERSVDPVMLEEIKSKTLRPFFNALKSGNVELIKQHFSGQMYEEYRLLLEENKGYPDLLRAYYKEAIFSVERGVTSGNRIIIDFSIELPGNRKQVSQYILQEQQPENETPGLTAEKRWNIIEQHRVRAW